MSAVTSCFCSMLLASPFLAIAAILVYYLIRRSVFKRKCREGRRASGFCPSSAALAAAFLLITTFYRPRLEFAIEARLREEEKTEADDEGDPETPEKQLNRQLRRIRKGEPVEQLELRL